MADGIGNVMTVGHEYPIAIEVDLKGLSSNDVGLELIVTENGITETTDLNLVEKIEFDVESCENFICKFKLNYKPDHPGSFNYGFRLYPKNEGLAHRQDFKFVKWL